jgi:hypothetical protein
MLNFAVNAQVDQLPASSRTATMIEVHVLAWHFGNGCGSEPFDFPTMTLDHALDQAAPNP